MIIDDPGGLHHGVADRRANEAEFALAQVFAQLQCQRSYCREPLMRFPSILDWRTANKIPDVRVETPEFFLHLQKSLRVRNRRVYFQAIANDARIRKNFRSEE